MRTGKVRKKNERCIGRDVCGRVQDIQAIVACVLDFDALKVTSGLLPILKVHVGKIVPAFKECVGQFSRNCRSGKRCNKQRRQHNTPRHRRRALTLC